MTVLAEDDRMMNMLMVLNDRCEDYGMKININKTNAVVIRKLKKIDMLIKDESIEQVDSFKYLGCNSVAFNRKRSIFCGLLDKRTKEEASEVLCVECSVVWCRDLDTMTE